MEPLAIEDPFREVDELARRRRDRTTEDAPRVREAEVFQPKMPTTVDEVKNLSRDQLTLLIALSHTNEIRSVIDLGEDALRAEIERWDPDERTVLARALAEVG